MNQALGMDYFKQVAIFPEIKTLDFRLPPELEAGEPPEARGLARDQVKLMVSYRGDGRTVHTRFDRLPETLDPGDLLVINTSGTQNAALPVSRGDETRLELHLSTHLPADLWSAELRQPASDGGQPFYTARPGETLRLPGGGQATLHTPYRADQRDLRRRKDPRVRLWVASLRLPLPVQEYLMRYGFPIRYKYVREAWPNSYYQTVYATEMGSAEMPSAGRAFTPELITRLVGGGVQIAPLILHTGVASLEEHEPPYEEYYRVPPETARLVNAARSAGKRVIAVGTTVVRALETVTGANGQASPGEGWTEHIVTPQSGVRSVDGLLTGMHEPRSTHLAMLEALAGVEHVRQTYAEALQRGYLWHEFGDLHLILP
ncbi:MAG TPA: S-adenosylmethionine:tRNA ribosyltransferase-isomerase [Anaerolineales bacterium]